MRSGSLPPPVTCHRRLRQPEHKVLQQLRRRGDDVFVVTEVLQTQTEMEVTRTHKQEGSGQFTLPGAICFQVCGEGRAKGRVGGQEGSDPRQSPAPAHAWPLNLEPGPEPRSPSQGKGQGHLSRKKTVTIPSGSTLAFRVAQLVIDPDWGEQDQGDSWGPASMAKA